MVRGRNFSLFGAAVVVCAGFAMAQPAPVPSRQQPLAIDSGFVTNPGKAGADVVYRTQVTVPGAPWLRLNFDQAVLAGHPDATSGSYMVITSVQDGAWQTLNAQSLMDWNYTSAYFNGDTVIVELYAFPGTGPNRLVMTEVTAGTEPGIGPFPESICGPTDNRVLSNDPRQGRLMPVGCTAWMITNGNCANRFLTAGHCISAGTTNAVVQFNVPLSNSNGSVNNPPPQDQFAVTAGSIQSTGSGGVGNDAAQFFTSVNANTGLHARQHMGGAAYVLANQAPAANNQTIRITGYGTTNGNLGTPLTWSQVQKTHTGPFVSRGATSLQYAVDTTGGNSGSPVVLESSGQGIGIHTHAGCTSTGGANNGTAIEHPGLQGFLANPLGPCAPFGAGVTPKGGPFNEGGAADHFNRANSANIGGEWVQAAGNINNFSLSSNGGAHTGNTSDLIGWSGHAGDYVMASQWVNVEVNGTGLQFVALAAGLGGTDNLFVKVQQQGGNGFGNVGFYHGNNGGGWSGITGGSSFFSITEFDQGRLRLSSSDDGNTVTLDIDTNFDGVPEQTYSRGGLNNISGNFGNRFGVGAFGPAMFDNWNVTGDCYDDGFNRADGAMSGSWASSAGTFSQMAISGNAGSHSGSGSTLMRNTAVEDDYRSQSQWVDARVNGNSLQFVALAAGMGGTDNLFVKVQQQGGNGFGNVGFYHGNNGGGWSGITGGSAFFSITEFDNARIRLSVSADGDTASLDIDSDFDGIADQSYSRGGLNNISGNFGDQFGIGAFGPAVFDNYNICECAQDTFQRPNGPIGPQWSNGVGTFSNWSVSGNEGSFSGSGGQYIVNDAVGSHSDSSQWLDIETVGTGLQYVALLGGLGGTDNYFIKLQQQNASGNFSHIGFYHGNNGGGWSGMTGGSSFFAVGTGFSSGRIRVSVGPDGDTVTLDIDTDFDGQPDESHSRGGLSNIKTDFGDQFGIGGFNVASFDNWKACPAVGPGGPPPCYPDCNGDNILNLADFGCFQTRFALGDPYADCNGDNVLNLADFGCFQTQFALGCP